jgi:hypothetical protein
MPRIDRLSYRDASRAKFSARIKQLLVLVLTVIFGILLSVTVNAQDANQRHTHLFKAGGNPKGHSIACPDFKKKEK